MTSRPERIAGAVLPLALVAAALALLAPSAAVAERSDLVLAGLVLVTALGIAPGDLLALRRRWAVVAALSVLPLLVLAPLAWLLSRAFAGPVREGVIALGLAPTEVAAAGLVALAGGDAALALAVVAGSLVASALAGPVALAALAGGGDADPAALAARFALIVLVPLAAGLAVRGLVPAARRGEPHYAAAATVLVAVLVYAALSGTDAAAESFLAAGLFLVATLLLAAVAARLVGGPARETVLFTTGLRDFAVAAALAEAAVGPAAAGVAGAYGLLMLLAGAAAAGRLRS